MWKHPRSLIYAGGLTEKKGPLCSPDDGDPVLTSVCSYLHRGVWGLMSVKSDTFTMVCSLLTSSCNISFYSENVNTIKQKVNFQETELNKARIFPLVGCVLCVVCYVCVWDEYVYVCVLCVCVCVVYVCGWCICMV